MQSPILRQGPQLRIRLAAAGAEPDTEVVLKAYAIGFFGAVLAILVVAGIWLVTHPRPELGLLWGETVYTSKQEFNGYLRAKGLSYETWLARNPYAAPWEPAATQARTDGGEEWTARLPLVGLALALGAALFLLKRARAPAAVWRIATSRRRRPPPYPVDETRDAPLVPAFVPSVEAASQTVPTHASLPPTQGASTRAASPRVDTSLFELLSPNLRPHEQDEPNDEAEGSPARMHQAQRSRMGPPAPKHPW